MRITFADGTNQTIDRSDITQVCLSTELEASGMQSKTHRSRISNDPPTNIRSKNVAARKLTTGDVLITNSGLKTIVAIES